MKYVDISSLANELYRNKFQSPYELKLCSDKRTQLMFDIESFYPDSIIGNADDNPVTIRTFYGTMIIRFV